MILNCGLEKTLDSPMDSKRSNQSILKEINPDYALEGHVSAPIPWPPDVKSRLIGKDLDAG